MQSNGAVNRSEFFLKDIVTSVWKRRMESKWSVFRYNDFFFCSATLMAKLWGVGGKVDFKESRLTVSRSVLLVRITLNSGPVPLTLFHAHETGVVPSNTMHTVSLLCLHACTRCIHMQSSLNVCSLLLTLSIRVYWAKQHSSAVTSWWKINEELSLVEIFKRVVEMG